MNSIGTFPEENEAFDKIILMVALAYGLLVLFTIIQIVSYHLYNGRFHPFSLIVMSKPTQKCKHDRID